MCGGNVSNHEKLEEDFMRSAVINKQDDISPEQKALKEMLKPVADPKKLREKFMI
jgi:hypothetical protein